MLIAVTRMFRGVPTWGSFSGSRYVGWLWRPVTWG